MTTSQTVKKLQETFDINAIYARSVLKSIHSKDIVGEAAKIIGDKPKPFVKWVGGKRQLLKQFRLMNLYPPERFNTKTGKYFEPFLNCNL